MQSAAYDVTSICLSNRITPMYCIKTAGLYRRTTFW